MSIGYACLTVGVPGTELKSCIMKNASESRLMDLIAYNLTSLEHILDYNVRNGIQLFRISSDLIPFGSSPVNTLPWWEVFEKRFLRLGRMISECGIRVSMHPGQYTVLNSPNTEVVMRAVQDLTYHCRVLDSLFVGSSHKIILHIGGVYQNKEQSLQRFIESYHLLSRQIKDRLVLENDDKSYHIKDVLKIAAAVGAPVIFDNLHHKVNPCDEKDELHLINLCGQTWKEKDGVQKIHYSQQHPGKKPGSHSDTIDEEEFFTFYQSLQRKDIDIMLEVKDKNLSAVKCIHRITQ